ncbi:hypothetical protein [Streptomyces antibioticus]
MVDVAGLGIPTAAGVFDALAAARPRAARYSCCTASPRRAWPGNAN